MHIYIQNIIIDLLSVSIKIFMGIYTSVFVTDCYLIPLFDCFPQSVLGDRSA